jgi:hypothetical protein
MDDFRKFQKQECLDGGSSHSKYGCSCCRKIADLNAFKKYSRHKAKSKLRETDRRTLKNVKGKIEKEA